MTPIRPEPRRGVTLLELLVVLLILGLAAGLLAPRFAASHGADDPYRALESARAAAVRRGETLRLAWTATGSWALRAAADTAGAILSSGTDGVTAAPGHAGALVITPLGTCLPDGPVAADPHGWDPARCRPITP